jgi:hypothetical protein
VRVQDGLPVVLGILRRTTSKPVHAGLSGVLDLCAVRHQPRKLSPYGAWRAQQFGGYLLRRLICEHARAGTRALPRRIKFGVSRRGRSSSSQKWVAGLRPASSATILMAGEAVR